MDYARQMLSELMSPFEDSKKHFSDPLVCKNYLVRFCPSELFVNTKSDLGPCTKIHDEKLRIQYINSEDKEKYGYEEDFYHYIQRLVSDLDRKIKRGNERLGMKPDEGLLNPNKEEREETIIMIEEKIKKLNEKMEECAEEGRVQEASTINKEVERLQAELDSLRDENNPIFKQEKRMEVCTVCGAFLVINDTSKRLDAHMEGKQHSGYKQIREAYEEWKSRRENERPGRDYEDYRGDRREEGRRSGGGRRGSHENYRDRDRDRERDRARYGSSRGSRRHGSRRDRDRRDKDRERSPSPRD